MRKKLIYTVPQRQQYSNLTTQPTHPCQTTEKVKGVWFPAGGCVEYSAYNVHSEVSGIWRYVPVVKHSLPRPQNE